MQYHVIKYAAVDEVFLGVAGEFEGWLPAMEFAMAQEYAGIAKRELHNGRRIMFDAVQAEKGIVDQAAYDAFRAFQRAQPVINVYD